MDRVTVYWVLGLSPVKVAAPSSLRQFQQPGHVLPDPLPLTVEKVQILPIRENLCHISGPEGKLLAADHNHSLWDLDFILDFCPQQLPGKDLSAAAEACFFPACV